QHCDRQGRRPVMTASLLVQSAVIGLSIGSIYILMALGLTLMFGMMHIINFAHGAVYMLGAFVIYYVFFQGGAPYFAAFAVAMVLLGVFGYLASAASIDRLRAGSNRPWWRCSRSPRFSRRPATPSSVSSTSTCRRSSRAPGAFWG